MLRGIRANRQRPQQTAEQPATKANRALQDIWMAESKKDALALRTTRQSTSSSSGLPKRLT
jgi:hypothetical protein